MKVSRYILLAAGIAVLLTTIAWFLRNYLIEQISNPLLQQYGIKVTDISLDALARNDASIGRLELLHEKGTTIIIEGLTLPFGVGTAVAKIYAAKKVSIITATRSDDEPLELALLIKQFLSLPDSLDNSQIRVAEVSLPPYPALYDVRWDIADTAQVLQGTIESVTLSATITPTDTGDVAVAFSVPGAAAAAASHSITAKLQQSATGLSLTGVSTIELPAWQSLAWLTGIVPAAMQISSGTATLDLAIQIPDDVSQSPTALASLSPVAPLQMSYTATSGAQTAILVQSATPLSISATFPEVDWTLAETQASLRVSDGEWRDMPVSVHKLACRSGPVCSLQTRLRTGARDLPLGRVAQLEFVSQQDLSFPNSGVEVNIKPGAALMLAGVVVAETRVAKINAKLVSGATLELVDAGWQLAMDSVDAGFEGLSVAEAVALTAPLFLERLRVSELDGLLSLATGLYAPSCTAALDRQTIALPGFKGSASLSGADAAADLMTVGLQKNGSIEARHSLASGIGRLNVSDATLAFGKRHLSRLMTPAPASGDLVAGSISFSLGANWASNKPGAGFNAQASLDLADLAGYYNGTVVTGLSSRLKGRYRNESGFVSDPSKITINLLEMGLPVTGVSADYALDLNSRSINVENLRMTAVGGVVTADPFSFHTDRPVNTLVLDADSIDLTQLLSLQEFESVEVSGSISARLPVTIEGDTVTISNGEIISKPPGGVIRYRSEVAANESDASGIGFAKRVLSNFEYKTLTSDVSLTREGDLKLKLQLTGRNPDLKEKRPVVLNLGVENNIPQMLRSLRAARAVEDVLERRLGK